LKVWSNVAADLENEKCKRKTKKEITHENPLQALSENKYCIKYSSNHGHSQT
jgi:hypothetical protein